MSILRKRKHDENLPNTVSITDLSDYSNYELIGVGRSYWIYSVMRFGHRYLLRMPVSQERKSFDETTEAVMIQTMGFDWYCSYPPWQRINKLDEVRHYTEKVVDFGTEPCPWIVTEYSSMDLMTTINSRDASIDDVIDILRILDKLREVGIYLPNLRPEDFRRIGNEWKISITALTDHFSNKGEYSPIRRQEVTQYSAPEQISSGYGEVGPQTAIWRMGIICYMVLAHEDPYNPEEFMEMYKNKRLTPPDFSRITEEYPEYCEVIKKSLAVDGKDRFSTPGEMAGALCKKR